MRVFKTFFTHEIPDANYSCDFSVLNRENDKIYGVMELTASDVDFSIKFKWSADENQETGEVENIERDEEQEIEYVFDEDEVLIYCYVENKFIDYLSHKQEEFVIQAIYNTYWEETIKEQLS
ncbi:hypothetical protein [Pseudomonas syringae]|uniref:hypothetical protein n=1 Tax=Pseudomonas syringae TaxID=317 RepID=UPI001F1F2BBE|nr:hypothetical protein [Pseudomonas syringae]MBL3828718.1 hypothetical protein [Pseudomonas syringae pv. theae]MBL3834130.1 hypothetical protein [Pseudomonas syringae pv. theae]GKQ45105.1 hypothetical protein PSTH2693_08135 [Pseudomonas syringae pv. theae]